jgi:hypothetical protein
MITNKLVGDYLFEISENHTLAMDISNSYFGKISIKNSPPLINNRVSLSSLNSSLNTWHFAFSHRNSRSSIEFSDINGRVHAINIVIINNNY